MFGEVGVLQRDRVGACLSSVGPNPFPLFVSEWLLLALSGGEEDYSRGLGGGKEEGEEEGVGREGMFFCPVAGQIDHAGNDWGESLVVKCSLQLSSHRTLQIDIQYLL